MPAVLLKFSVSPSADEKPAVIDTVALWMLALSGSVRLSAGSTIAAGAPSLNAALPPVVAMVGASLTGVIEMFFVAAAESTSPSLTLNSTVFDVTGVSLLDLNLIDRSAVV